MCEGEVVSAARQEGRGPEVLLPLVGHALFVVEFHVRMVMEELKHPCFHPSRRPCPGP